MPKISTRRQRKTCGCSLYQRCSVAYQLRAAHQEAWETHDPAAITQARQTYGMHLRTAGVRPGAAVWKREEENRGCIDDPASA